MKTKNFLSLAAMALLMTACSNEDTFVPYDTIEPENTANEITIIATLSGNAEATTRAVADGGETKWNENEEIAVLFKVGGTDTKRVATITNVDGSGTATIQFTVPSETTDGTDCTLVYPASAANDANTGVKTYADLFATQDGTLNGLDVRVGKGTIKVSTPGLTVSTTPAAQFAIFKFTLGAAIDKTHPLTIKDDADNVITTIKPETSTTTVYAAMEEVGSTKYYKFSATTADNKIISKSGSMFISKNIYYTQTLACPALGDLYYSDGTYSPKNQTDKTPIGVIAYLGTDNFTENGTTVGGSSFVGHGLVMCLKNASEEIAWSTTSSQAYTGNDFVTDVAGLKRSEGVSGYSATADLATDATTYPAAAAAKNYADLTAPAGTTGWFLPSAQQWVKMIEGLGGLPDGAPSWNKWFDPDHKGATAWQNALEKAGTGNYDSMTSEHLYYWSSSEYSDDLAVYLHVDATSTGTYYGFDWSIANKNTVSYRRVRPVLAF